eukprot:Em0012g568a
MGAAHSLLDGSMIPAANISLISFLTNPCLRLIRPPVNSSSSRLWLGSGSVLCSAFHFSTVGLHAMVMPTHCCLPWNHPMSLLVVPHGQTPLVMHDGVTCESSQFRNICSPTAQILAMSWTLLIFDTGTPPTSKLKASNKVDKCIAMNTMNCGCLTRQHLAFLYQFVVDKCRQTSGIRKDVLDVHSLHRTTPLQHRVVFLLLHTIIHGLGWTLEAMWPCLLLLKHVTGESSLYLCPWLYFSLLSFLLLVEIPLVLTDSASLLTKVTVLLLHLLPGLCVVIGQLTSFHKELGLPLLNLLLVKIDSSGTAPRQPCL